MKNAVVLISILFIAILLFAFPTLYGAVRTRINSLPNKEAILVLGGSRGSRERFAVGMAKAMDEAANLSNKVISKENQKILNTTRNNEPIKIWISRGRPRQEVLKVAKLRSIAPERIILDNKAVDTVTNFTTMAPLLYKDNVTKVYVVTDHFHIKRAMTIASIVLRYYGITPIAAPTGDINRLSSEWKLRRYRDRLRSVMWFYTGKSASRLIIVRNILRKIGLHY